MGESQATTMGLKTALTDMLGIEAPIIQGGMQHVGTAEMASAVSNAGGLGILTGLTQTSPEELRKEIRRCRTMTDKPFGVNLTILPMLIPADYDGYAAVVAEERVTMVEIAGGNPKTYIKLMHDHGVKVLHKSATIRHALKAQAAGVDLIEVVGYEASIAGGQPGDEVGSWLLPSQWEDAASQWPPGSWRLWSARSTSPSRTTWRVRRLMSGAPLWCSARCPTRLVCSRTT